MSAGVVAAKVGAALLSDERGRKAVGWIITAVLSPLILIIAVLCSLGSGGAEHNNAAVEACFYGVAYSSDVPAEYKEHVDDMRAAFSLQKLKPHVELFDTLLVQLHARIGQARGLRHIVLIARERLERGELSGAVVEGHVRMRDGYMMRQIEQIVVAAGVIPIIRHSSSSDPARWPPTCPLRSLVIAPSSKFMPLRMAFFPYFF